MLYLAFIYLKNMGQKGYIMIYKLVAGVVTACLIMGQVAYADGPSDWAEADISDIEMVGLTTDRLQSAYTEPVDRLSFCQLIIKTYKALTGHLNIDVTQDAGFDDTEAIFVNEAYTLGLMNGTSEGQFSPQGLLTREQMIVSLMRLVSLIEAEQDISFDLRTDVHSFSDQDQISSWALEQMADAVGLGLVGGTGGGLLNPKAYTTVEQVLITNYRFVSLLEEQTGSTGWKENLAILNASTGLVTCDVLNLRSEPLIEDDNIITRLSAGDLVTIINKDQTWYQVSVDDYTGYVHSDYIFIVDKSITTDELRLNLRDYALNFIGTPYVYGACSLTDGTDCAGFTQSVFKAYGISLSRSSSGQGGDGYAISQEELQVGDLVTYGYGGNISHVAMYIGEGQVIHATTSYGVKVTDMYGFLYKPLIGFRRVIP